MARDPKDAYTETVESAAQFDDILDVVNRLRPPEAAPWTRLELLLLTVSNRLTWVDVEEEDEKEDWQS